MFTGWAPLAEYTICDLWTLFSSRCMPAVPTPFALLIWSSPFLTDNCVSHPSVSADLALGQHQGFHDGHFIIVPGTLPLAF